MNHGLMDNMVTKSLWGNPNCWRNFLTGMPTCKSLAHPLAVSTAAPPIQRLLQLTLVSALLCGGRHIDIVSWATLLSSDHERSRVL